MDLYEEAWNMLTMVFGEQLNEASLETMDAILDATKLDREEGTWSTCMNQR